AKRRLAQAPSRRKFLQDVLARSYLEQGDLVAARKIVPSEVDLSSVPLAFYEGEWEQAEMADDRSLEEARRRGSRDHAEDSLHSLATIHRVRGDPTRAETLLQASLELSGLESETRLPWQVKHRTELALVLCEKNCVENARAQVDRCREMIGSGEDWRGIVGLVATAEAVVSAAEGKHEDAEKQF